MATSRDKLKTLRERFGMSMTLAGIDIEPESFNTSITASIISSIKNINIPEETIIKITDDIKKTRIPGITKEEYNKLTREQQCKSLIVIVSNDPYEIIYQELNTIFSGLKYMHGSDVKVLFDSIKQEISTPPIIQYTIFRSPLSDRLIATVTKIIWNGVDLLNDNKIMLYKSTGKSRLTGLDGYWLPYLGEKYKGVVAKLEDDYVKTLEYILTMSRPLPDYYKPIIIDIINNINSYKTYKRFINKTYLIASYILSLDEKHNHEYIPDEKYNREYTPEEKSNAQINMTRTIEKLDGYIDYIPITAEFIKELIKPPTN